MTSEFNCNGHCYKVINAEGGNDYYIIRDGRQTRKVKKEIADRAIEYINKLFD